MKRLEPIVFSLVFTLVGMPMSVLAQDADSNAPGYKHDVNITGKQGGPYNIKATVKPKMENVPMGLFKKGDTVSQSDSDEDKRQKAKDRWLIRMLGGKISDDVDLSDPMTTAVVNELVDNNGVLFAKPTPAASRTAPPAATSSQPMDPESHHHQQGGGPEDHHKLPTDGSPGAEAITNSAITTFYDNLPRDVTYRLAGMGTDPMATVHAAGDPYAPFAIAMSNSDFLRMRQLAQNEDVTNLRERIAMLGLAGATALRNLSNPANKDTFPAKDTLRKVAEDLHYAGQGLDDSKPNEAKLKAVCEDISRIWSNMNQPKASK